MHIYGVKAGLVSLEQYLCNGLVAGSGGVVQRDLLLFALYSNVCASVKKKLYGGLSA